MFYVEDLTGWERGFFGIRQNKQVCKSVHLSAVKKTCMFEAFPVVQPCGCAIICSLCHVSSCFCWLSAASFLRWTDLRQQLFSSCLVIVFVAVTITNRGTWQHPDTAEALNIKTQKPQSVIWQSFDHFQILQKGLLIPANFPSVLGAASFSSLSVSTQVITVSLLYPCCIPVVSLLYPCCPLRPQDSSLNKLTIAFDNVWLESRK